MKIMKYNNGFAPILVILAVVICLAAVGGVYFYLIKTPEQKSCTLEAKICPDGSSVGRTGPNCEFAACPEENASSSVSCLDSEWFCQLTGKCIKKGEVCTNGLAGGSVDEYGCNPTAGYTWCEIKNKCLRTWEEKCVRDSTSSVETIKIYQDNAHSFKISYPGNWEFIEMNSTVVFEPIGVALSGANDVYAFPIILQIEKNSQGLSANQWLEKKQKESGLIAEGITQVVIDGTPGVKFSDKSIVGQNYTTLYLAKDNLLYGLVYDSGVYSAEYLDIFEQMAASFEFLK